MQVPPPCLELPKLWLSLLAPAAAPAALESSWGACSIRPLSLPLSLRGFCCSVLSTLPIGSSWCRRAARGRMLNVLWAGPEEESWS